ncbi:hypothetical protein [Tessaracoccus coleopterorum]|uniref:hypothetical protein n=1 Tax=Tessaracoccus coleopterorum TaxID=2714950 RepID=UPI0018D319F5|nr:hypothetical protein [Tessaracoccus coleopterorum]
MLRAADELSRAHFDQGLTDEGVTILDPFTGTGTYIVRLLESGIIRPRTWPGNTPPNCCVTRSCCWPTTSPASTSKPPTNPSPAPAATSRSPAQR